MGRPMLPTVNYTAPRCATCEQWRPNAMGVGRCVLPADDPSETTAAMWSTGSLYTRLDFGCIFHERAVES